MRAFSFDCPVGECGECDYKGPLLPRGVAKRDEQICFYCFFTKTGVVECAVCRISMGSSCDANDVSVICEDCVDMLSKRQDEEEQQKKRKKKK
jgi:hypothetical protein